MIPRSLLRLGVSFVLAEVYPQFKKQIIARARVIVDNAIIRGLDLFSLARIYEGLESCKLNFENLSSLLQNPIDLRMKTLEPTVETLLLLGLISEECPSVRKFISHKLLAKIFSDMPIEEVDSWLKKMRIYSSNTIEEVLKEKLLILPLVDLIAGYCDKEFGPQVLEVLTKLIFEKMKEEESVEKLAEVFVQVPTYNMGRLLHERATALLKEDLERHLGSFANKICPVRIVLKLEKAS